MSNTAQEFEYRPHLDGLRAIAVTLVLAFHSELALLSAGFIGVDIFFVLSGFLVCSILLAEAQTKGRIDLIGFWARRVRRLLPAASATIVGTSVLALLFVPASQRTEFPDSAGASSLWYANWHFIASSRDYFSADIDTSPFLHFWSLAIEEQFYAFFPLLFLISWSQERQVKTLSAIVVALCFMSLGLQCFESDENRAYMGTDTRAYQIFFGVLLAIFLNARRATTANDKKPGRPKLASALGTFFAGCLILFSSSLFDLSTSLRGIIASLTASLLILGLELSQNSRLHRLLRWRLLVQIGKLSYGIYLWHWPIIVSLNYYRPLAPLPLFLLCFTASVLMAALSLRFLEDPIRNLPSGNKPATLALGGTLALAVGLIAAPAVLAGDSAPVIARGQNLQSGTPNNWEVISQTSLDRPIVGGCNVDETTSCVVVEGTGDDVLLFGDSHARMYFPALEIVARQNNWRLSAATEPGCPWGNSVAPRRDVNASKCVEFHETVYQEILPSLAPDLVILINRTQVSSRVERGSRQSVDEALNLMESSIDDLKGHAEQILVIEPSPEFEDGDFFPRDCLAAAAFVEECSRPMIDAVLEDAHFRSIAGSDPRVYSLSLDDLICETLEACWPIRNSVLIMRDRTHISVPYAQMTADELGRRIDVALKRESSQ